MSKPIQIFWPGATDVKLVQAFVSTAAGHVRFEETSYDANQYGGLMVGANGGLSQMGWSFKDFQTNLVFTSTNNISAVNFTITGQDLFGNNVTEVLAGPNATSVTSVNAYATNISITSSAAVSNLKVENSGIGRTGYIFADYNRSNWSASLQAIATDVGLTFVVQGAIVPVLERTTNVPTTESHQLIVSGTLNNFLAVTSPFTAIWANITAGGATGRTLALTFLQQGTRS